MDLAGNQCNDWNQGGLQFFINFLDQWLLIIQEYVFSSRGTDNNKWRSVNNFHIYSPSASQIGNIPLQKRTNNYLTIVTLQCTNDKDPTLLKCHAKITRFKRTNNSDVPSFTEGHLKISSQAWNETLLASSNQQMGNTTLLPAQGWHEENKEGERETKDLLKWPRIVEFCRWIGSHLLKTRTRSKTWHQQEMNDSDDYAVGSKFHHQHHLQWRFSIFRMLAACG